QLVTDDRFELLPRACELALPLIERCDANAVCLEEPELAHAVADHVEQPFDLGLALAAIGHHAASSRAGTSCGTSASSLDRHSMTTADSSAATSEMTAST